MLGYDLKMKQDEYINNMRDNCKHLIGKTLSANLIVHITKEMYISARYSIVEYTFIDHEL